MPPIAHAVLCVEDVHVAFGAINALNGLSFELYAGEMLGLLGPNGAGKTTLINGIAGRQPLGHGAIEIQLEGSTNELLGIVPQEIAVYPDLTVLQNLSVFGKLHGVRPRLLRQRIRETLEWAGLSDRRHSITNSLSGGMQRRLNLACSVLHDPPILLLDEPTVGVDPQSRERIFTMLEELQRQGTAILLTTHHLDEAQHRCSRIAIMDRGHIIESGTFDELIDRTVGSAQHVRIRFSEIPDVLPALLQLTDSDRDAVGVIDDPSRQLPALLSELEELQLPIEHLNLLEPTLQNLFLQLTGKELRE